MESNKKNEKQRFTQTVRRVVFFAQHKTYDHSYIVFKTEYKKMNAYTGEITTISIQKMSDFFYNEGPNDIYIYYEKMVNFYSDNGGSQFIGAMNSAMKRMENESLGFDQDSFVTYTEK